MNFTKTDSYMRGADILCWYFPLQFSFFVQVGVFESEKI